MSVTYLDPHNNMTVTEALKVAEREEAHDILILGYDSDGALFVTSSDMSNGEVNFMIDVFKLKLLQEVK